MVIWRTSGPARFRLKAYLTRLGTPSWNGSPDGKAFGPVRPAIAAESLKSDSDVTPCPVNIEHEGVLVRVVAGQAKNCGV